MATEMEPDLGRSSAFFLLAGLVFLGSLLLVGYDLFRGNDILRGLIANAVSALVIVALAGVENLRNPEANIDTRFEAVRAVAFFYSVYLVLGGGVLALIGLVFAPDFRVGLAVAGVGVVGSLLVFLTGTEGSTTGERLATLVGIVGLFVFVGSIGLFFYELWIAGDVFRAIAANAVGAALFILWAAHDMPSDPDSHVETGADAAGVALLFYGIYLVVAGVGIVLTVVFDHAYGGLGLWYLGLGLVTVVLGFVLAPRDAVREDDSALRSEEGEPTTVDENTETQDS